MRKNILITGASSGLGRGMAREFARLGRNLALCARRVDRLEELRRELEAAHPAIRVLVRPLDVTNHEQIFEVFRAFQRDLGTLDRVIVNAGIGKGQPIGTGNFFRANLPTAETNFVAALAQCEAAVEIFRAQNAGHLVTISSISALRGMRRNLTTYAASKA
ncbi:MAG TPA: SDR family oxidoreductase, partial [Anaeromyxobacteraceae bacterium]|nr:SDR family oxidoreductase [Anaeromyxobacteraceae bacterium]